MSEPRLVEELARMDTEYEPLLPVERALIWWTFGTGVALLALLVLVSRVFLP
jgi:hypothetical protein